MNLSSDIPIQLPTYPLTRDPELNIELSKVYNAIQVLQAELSAVKQRCAQLEAYNQAHP